jgi:hypothetical protein
VSEHAAERGRVRARPRAVSIANATSAAITPVISSKVRLCGWSLNFTAGTFGAVESSVNVAAAAAGTLTLNGYGAVSSVTVTPAAAWPAGNNVVTLSNVTGGPITVEIEGGTENAAVLTFPNPAPAAGTPQVTVPAIVGGPAYTIDATGLSGNPGAQAPTAVGQFLDGGQVLGVTAGVVGLTDTQWLGDEGIYVGTSIALQMFFGSCFGVIYVNDHWQGMDDEL